MTTPTESTSAGTPATARQLATEILRDILKREDVYCQEQWRAHHIERADEAGAAHWRIERVCAVDISNHEFGVLLALLASAVSTLTLVDIGVSHSIDVRDRSRDTDTQPGWRMGMRRIDEFLEVKVLAVGRHNDGCVATVKVAGEGEYSDDS